MLVQMLEGRARKDANKEIDLLKQQIKEMKTQSEKFEHVKVIKWFSR